MSLRDQLKQRIIDSIIRDAQKKMRKKYTVIVADDVTIKILSHCFRMHELNELDVGVVLNVKYPRERVKVSPIYFLSSNIESAKHMCADYSNPKETRYAAPVHVYFNSKVTKDIIELVKMENIRKYMKTFSEIHCDYLVLEQRVFSFNGGFKSFNDLYIKKDFRSDELNKRASQLVGLCLTLKEEPNIRYSSSSRNAKELAELFNQQFNDIIGSNSIKDWNPNKQNPGTLIIIDRTDDPLTPLLHNLSFQPMVMDLLCDDIKDDNTGNIKIYNLGGNNAVNDKGRAFPDEQDQVWCKYRHTFIGEVVSKLPNQFKVWQKNNAVVQLAQSSNNNNNNNNDDPNATTTTQQLISAARDMPQYQKLVKQYTTNINMASKIMDIFKNSGLRQVFDLEQDMSTKIDVDGSNVDKKKMTTAFCNQVLLDVNKSKSLKLRVFMMYIICQGGMKPDQRKKLLQQSGFDDKTEDTICNLGYLGVTLQSNRPKGKATYGTDKYWKEVVKIAKSKVNTTSIERYISVLEYILSYHLAGNLIDNDYPWIKKSNNAINKPIAIKSWRKHGKNKNKNNNNDNNNDNNINNNNNNSNNGPRIIIYIIGGLSYSEIKSAYQFSKDNNCDVYIGSTLIYSPKEYVNCFKTQSNTVSNNNNDNDIDQKDNTL